MVAVKAAKSVEAFTAFIVVDCSCPNNISTCGITSLKNSNQNKKLESFNIFFIPLAPFPLLSDGESSSTVQQSTSVSRNSKTVCTILLLKFHLVGEDRGIQ